MRIALLTYDYPPVPTGLGRAAAEIASGLAGEGVDVSVITLDRAGCAIQDGVRVVGAADVLGPGRKWLRRRAALGHLAAPAAFAQALSRLAPVDLVEATNWYAPAARVPRQVPLVIRNSTPATEIHDRPHTWRDRLDLRAAGAIESSTARRADALISNTHHHAQRISNLYRVPSHVPHHVIGLSLSQATIDMGRAAPPPPDTAPWRLVFVGRAEPRKGFDETLLAFAALHRERTAEGGAVLDIIGLDAPTLLARCDALAIPPEVRAAITAHGRADDRTLFEVLGRSHLVLAPSRYESYGLVYREAAAFGRPLVATAQDPSAREFLGAVGCGVLAERCSADTIATAAGRLIDAPDQRTVMRERGLAHAASLQRRTLAVATLEVYEAVLAARASGKGRRDGRLTKPARLRRVREKGNGLSRPALPPVHEVN